MNTSLCATLSCAVSSLSTLSIHSSSSTPLPPPSYSTPPPPLLPLHSSSSILPLHPSSSTPPTPLLSLHPSPSTPPPPLLPSTHPTPLLFLPLHSSTWSSVFNVSSAFPSWTPHHDHIWDVLAFVKQSFYDKSAWRNEYQEGEGEEGTGEVFDEAAFRQEAQKCVKESLQSINHPKDDGRSTHTRAHTHAHTSGQTCVHTYTCTHKWTNTRTSCSMSAILYLTVSTVPVNRSDSGTLHSQPSTQSLFPF